MNKGLEALENIKIDMEYVTRLDFVEPVVRGEVQQSLYKIYHRETPELEIIEKELKALEIIRNKSVNVRNLIIYCFEMKDTYKEYVEAFNYYENYWELGKELLTKEEFDSLREVLL